MPFNFGKVLEFEKKNHLNLKQNNNLGQVAGTKQNLLKNFGVNFFRRSISAEAHIVLPA